MKTVYNFPQKSEEWYKIREQYPLTASNAQAIGNQGKGLETLVNEVLAKKYSIQDYEKRYSNEDLDRGIELEPLARSIYELRTGQKVEEVGFVIDEEISKVGGASPDGVIGDFEGLVEIKSFNNEKHFELICQYKETGTFDIESKYQWQMQQQILFTGAKWCDYVAFNPNYKESLLIQRVYKDEEKIEKIKQGLKLGEELLNKKEQIYAIK